ncbi:hypothetical protein [Adlercreutzia sp. ZJ141]|uniref:hypothetical protein n=1 Tax=Adlercreutzia sp. ZJ141 TaxID=2709406 RepID=UPI0013EA0191|nr:hypothetical protein [Adlercreutzia sp. ZJ141]
MADIEFEIDHDGLQEICKSAGMKSELLRQAFKLADAANADAHSHEAKWVGSKGFEHEPYGAHVDVLSRTAVGAAHTRTKLGRINEAKYKSLGKQCH